MYFFIARINDDGALDPVKETAQRDQLAAEQMAQDYAGEFPGTKYAVISGQVESAFRLNEVTTRVMEKVPVDPESLRIIKEVSVRRKTALDKLANS